MPNKGQKKSLITVLSTMVLTLILSQNVNAAILFQDDTFADIDSDGILLDSLNQASGDLIIQFGSTLAETLKWSSTNSRFEFSDDVDIADGLTVDTDTLVVDAVHSRVGIGDSTPSRLLEIGNGNVLHYMEGGSDVYYTLDGESNGIFWSIGVEDSSDADFIIANTPDLSEPHFFLGGDGGSYNNRAGFLTTTPGATVDIQANGDVLEMGTATASDVRIVFDDGADRTFGWDDSENSFSTFDQQLRFRTRQSSSPPVTCSATVAGMQWMDTDNGMNYICDTSNGRNKWLTTQDVVIFGDENGSCTAGADPNSNASCNVDWGNGLGTDGGTVVGFYLPHNITITGYGFSEDNDACTSGSFDLEVWGTESSTDDNNYKLQAEVATGLTGQAHNSNSSNVDIKGGQYILWGIDNNCGQNIDDWNLILYYRWLN